MAVNAVIGKPVNRVDGRLKVTGAAHYTAEHQIDNLAYAVLVKSTIGRGRITQMDVAAAEQAPGAIAVLTHQNAPRLNNSPDHFDLTRGGIQGENLLPLQDDVVHYYGQTIGVVVAETLEQAEHAATLVRVAYEEQKPVVQMDDAQAVSYLPTKFYGEDLQVNRGDPSLAFTAAPVRIEQTYTTPIEHHHPMEPHATIAVWSGDQLTLYEGTQWVNGARKIVAQTLGIPLEKVRVICRFLGGGFGAKGITWSHPIVAAIAAQKANRPVKLVLSRQQMVTSAGHRPRTVQRVSLGAARDGKLMALRHDITTHTSENKEYVESCGLLTRILYACPNLEVKHTLTRLNLGAPVVMRAPGEGPGSYAIESAMDELAYDLGMNPIELRLINYADVNPQTGRPWSGKHLKECYRLGADRFGWARRNPRPRSMRDGHYLIGYGMATASYPGYRAPAQAAVRILADGSAVVLSGTHDIGTGTYTIMTQIAAECLGLPVERVRFELGDTQLPFSPPAVGAITAASTGSAVKAACDSARDKLIELALSNTGSPLHGRLREDVAAGDGRLYLKSDPSCGETFAEILQRNRMPQIECSGSANMHVTEVETSVNKKCRSGGAADKEGEHPNEGSGGDKAEFAFDSFGAQFVEVHVDERLGRVRVARMLGVYDVGRVLNPKTARSQLIGGMIFGIGMALEEESVYDARSGRPVTRTLADYHVPVHADVPKIDVHFIDEPDTHFNALGARGVGEIGNVGTAAAITNAVFHATGVRVRDLPITPEKLL